EEDARHFHSALKNACDQHNPEYYPRFKKWCDEYFYIKHREERRGVGGIFFDYLRGDAEKYFSFVQSAAEVFLDSYLPIVRKRLNEPWGERERAWQLQRRGRYVEFNLVYDRGTTFGLETKGRIESILMSLPPKVEWHYNIQPEPHSPEEKLVDVLKTPKEWTQE
ncbi:MAG: coproporphyrinogen III oxidase, partial [bacterium]